MIDRAAWRYLEGPEQALMLRTIGSPVDAPVREEYRAWLAERGDARAELFAHEARSGGDAARVEEILARDESVRAWWSLVSSTAPIRNCGEAMIEGAAVRFAYRCPRSWDGLERTADAGARHCDTCLQLVHLCTTREEAEARAKRGDCIAVPAALAGAIGRDVTGMITGRPDPIAEWAKRVFPHGAGEE